MNTRRSIKHQNNHIPVGSSSNQRQKINIKEDIEVELEQYSANNQSQEQQVNCLNVDFFT